MSAAELHFHWYAAVEMCRVSEIKCNPQTCCLLESVHVLAMRAILHSAGLACDAPSVGAAKQDASYSKLQIAYGSMHAFRAAWSCINMHTS
jgi:hypothetical protein